MTIEIQAPDGSIVEFPDGTPDDVMTRAMQERFGGQSSQEPSSWFGDVAKSAGSGIVRGAAETLMFPVTAKRLLDQFATPIEMGGVNLVRSAFGYDPLPVPTAEQMADNPIDSALNAGQDAVRGFMDRNLHKPETTTGKYVQTIGEFAVPGGLPSKGVRLAPTAAAKVAEYGADATRGTVLPALASEAAGQATEGTKAEPWARFLAGLGVGVGGAALQTRNAPELVLRRAVGDPNTVNWDAAVALQNNPTGVRLTGPEAIAQAQEGASALPNLQRMVEGSTEGRAMTAPFFAARPGQVSNAVDEFLARIGPQASEPSNIGVRMSAAAERAIAATPEGQALADAIFGVGPRVTPMQAGETIQPAMRQVFEGREGMRNALADADYEAARNAAPTIPVDELAVSKTVRKPGYTRLDPGENQITGDAQMQPAYVPPQIQTPSMTSRTGPDYIQADVRPVLQLVDRLSADARLETAKALGKVRSMLFRDGGVDTSVRGLDSARGQIGDMISAAKNDGQMQAAKMLSDVQAKLDEALAQVPAYRSAMINFRAASEPLRPFEAPGLAKAIAKDEYGRGFTTPPENVPAALSTPSEARNFNSVAPPEARRALEQRIATDLLDKASDASGRVDSGRLASLLRDNEDLLASYPDVAQRLQAIVGSDAVLESVRASPLGRLANTDSTREAGNIILPADPLTGSQGETAKLVGQLSAEDPQVTQQALRQTLGDRFNRAMTETQEGNAEFGGAKFNKDIAGNTQRRASLDAAVGAATNGQVADDLSILLDVLQATGRRKPIGSATAFNEMLKGDLGSASLFGRAIDTAKTLGASFITQAGDAAKRAALRRHVNDLAELFTDPRSVELIRAATLRTPANLIPEAILRAALQTNAGGHDQSTESRR